MEFNLQAIQFTLLDIALAVLLGTIIALLVFIIFKGGK